MSLGSFHRGLTPGLSPRGSGPGSFPEMKGSRYGENLMRGLRKLSISSFPLILVASVVHSWWLLNQYTVGPFVCIEWCPIEAAAAIVSMLCLSMVFADVVLYVWVDDAFVRTRKKTVQLHYLVEILAREPLCMLFHTMYFPQYGYRPLLTFWACDVGANVILLLLPTLYGLTRRRLSCRKASWRHAMSQMSTAIIMSFILFGVNITIFDPRDAFLVVNNGYYVIKYIEIFVIWKLALTQGMDDVFFQIFWEAQLGITLLGMFVVWVVIPWQHNRNNQSQQMSAPPLPQLSRLLPNGELSSDDFSLARRRGLFAASPSAAQRAQALLELQSVRGPQASGVRGRTISRINSKARLELLVDVLEALCLYSQTQSSRNKPSLARFLVADVLWSFVLPWVGQYQDGEGGIIDLQMLDAELGSVLIRRRSTKTVTAQSVYIAIISHGTQIELVEDDAAGKIAGTYDGKCTRFSDERRTVWKRCESQESIATSTASSSTDGIAIEGSFSDDSFNTSEVLHLVLTQLLLAVRWEPTFLGSGPKVEELAEGVVATVDASQRPILSFLIRYGIGSQDLELVSEIYWSLWCLSQDTQDNNDSAYENARWVLIESLQGRIEFWDGVRGLRLGHTLDKQSGDADFCRTALHLLIQQGALWRQSMLLANLAVNVQGDAFERTKAVRHQLSEWRDIELGQTLPEDHYISPPVPPLKPINLVKPGGDDFISTPIDPGIRFNGVDINRCQVLSSSTAPLILSCWKEPLGDRPPEVAKYMVKLGDDLRQDQLVLQMLHLMGLVWKESLPAEEHEMLRFLPYKTRAMTPNAGYVKFVPGAVSLSKALGESHGDLSAWLNAHCPPEMSMEQVLSNLCGSTAAYCVATYVLGIGDRHLDNLQITPEGHFFHIDFGFIFGEDPKPFAPRLRLPQPVASVLLQATGNAENTLLDKCFLLAGRAYIALRRSMPLWVSLLRVTGHAGGAGCPRLKANADAAVVVVMDRLRADLGSHAEEEAASEFLVVLGESTEALYPVLTDKVHQLGLFWK
eukprot:TRINITY_DN57277_c0_g1_i1.p1 TRINITY_DN57277_c0_g1~~TRINITY_DN57277_c0_g1_i1.p1  ORF type:complete len:1027 (+),score=134.42 TRINITY_DN57277_c0_g1_i1:205-3285(+)